MTQSESNQAHVIDRGRQQTENELEETRQRLDEALQQVRSL